MNVYAIAETGRKGFVKVGIAKDGRSRLAGLQTAAARPLRLVHSQPVENARLVERVAHYLLREKRAAGEWFRVSEEEAVSAIAEAIASIDQPGWLPPWEVERAQKTAADAAARAESAIARALARQQRRARWARQRAAERTAHRSSRQPSDPITIRLPLPMSAAIAAIQASRMDAPDKATVIRELIVVGLRAAKQKKGRGA